VSTAFRVYFVAVGLALIAASLALLLNFRGFGRLWDDSVYTHSTEFIRLTRMPWPANPTQGRVARPYVGVVGLLLGVALILTGLFASQ
jgi:hypothetical protein